MPYFTYTRLYYIYKSIFRPTSSHWTSKFWSSLEVLMKRISTFSILMFENLCLKISKKFTHLNLLRKKQFLIFCKFCFMVGMEKNKYILIIFSFKNCNNCSLHWFIMIWIYNYFSLAHMYPWSSQNCWTIIFSVSQTQL